MNQTPDTFELSRFLEAQEGHFEQALAEITRGEKRSHWMWFIFPQYQGLGLSSMAQHYSIKSLDEARAYLNHPVLGPRLLQCVNTLLSIESRSAKAIFGSPDDLKLRSCATLFACVSSPSFPFKRILEKFYGGESDSKTLTLLGLR